VNDNNENIVLEYVEKFSEVFNSMVQEVLTRNMRNEPADIPSMFDPKKLTQLLTSDVQVDTAKLMAEQMAFIEKQGQLWRNAAKAMLGNKVEPVVSEAKGDRRFKDDDWSSNPVYSYLKQAYLLNSQMLQSMVSTLKFSDPKAGEQVRFYTRQYLSSVSPTNSILTNPEVCREIIETKGQSLVKGVQNFLRDLEQSPAEAFKITQTDMDAFTLGGNLATTPGKVVFQNDLIQLIQYEASTEKVYQHPIIITPPFINKYYILDLDKKKSLMRWLVAQGYSVFVISWVNPGAGFAEKDFGDYMKEGPIAALDTVQKITGADKINMVGWCVGGTLLGTTAAYLKAKGDKRINSLTFLTTLLEFSEPGELGNYLSEQMMILMESNADTKGILDGRILGLSFSMLRENSLFWSYFIENYLKGKDPAAFDILYWNSDSTNIPAAVFKQYVRNTYWENKLKEPGGMVIDGVPIDLSKIDQPTYFLSTIVDHIVPWQGTYKGAKLLSGPTRFVLAGSGHLAGVINPVEGGKYPHWLNDELPETAEAWFEGAQQHEGSWWSNWDEWLSPMSGDRVQALKPGVTLEFPALEDAPGSYIKVRL
jgi:poly[(R)-3-hydroxyalkanoate] polymerase subunit PhaC